MLVTALAFFFLPRTWALPYWVQLDFTAVRDMRNRHVAHIVANGDAIGLVMVGRPKLSFGSGPTNLILDVCTVRKRDFFAGVLDQLEHRCCLQFARMYLFTIDEEVTPSNWLGICFGVSLQALQSQLDDTPSKTLSSRI